MAYSDAGSKSMVLIVVVLGISASLFIAMTTNTFPIFPNANGTSTTTTSQPAVNQTAHSPIHILGDEDFSAQAITEGWLGTGTLDTPYVIQGIRIHAEESCIRIENVSVHFQIRYCTLTGGTAWDHAGIHLIHTQNGHVFNCTIFTEVAGIWLDDVSECIIECCDIKGAVIGANVTHSNEVLFCFNQIRENYIPLGVFFCANTTLQENVIFGSEMGLGVFESTDIYIHANTYFDCREGISFHGVGGIISDNIIAYNDAEGLILGSHSSGVQVIMNLFGFNGEVNAADYGSENIWYDGNSSGNYWSDFDGEPPYFIPGSAGSMDPYPQLLTEEWLSEMLPYMTEM